MNPTAFSELFTEIPEEYIVSAAYPQRRPVRWYSVSAVAACIVLLISAAIYPKLRTQTPAIIVPAASTAEHTETTAAFPEQTETSRTETSPAQTSETHTTASQAQTETTASNTTASETLSAESSGAEAVSTASSLETAPVTTTDTVPTVTTATEPPKTEESGTASETELLSSKTTVTEPESRTSETGTTVQPPSAWVPLWKGSILYLESTSTPHISCRFSLSGGEMDDFTRSLYGIPQDFDLTQQPCLLIRIDTAYSNAVITGCETVQNGITLLIAYPGNSIAPNQQIHYALPIPDGMTLVPEACTARYQEIADEALLPDMETQTLNL